MKEEASGMVGQALPQKTEMDTEMDTGSVQ